MNESEQNDAVAAVRRRVDRATELQDWDSQGIAAVSILCERLVVADPGMRGFVGEIKEHAAQQTYVRPGHDFMATVPWISLVHELDVLVG